MFRHAIAALALLAAAFGQTYRVAAKPPATYRISGAVVHASNGERLPHTELAILSVENYKVVQRVFSDEEGRFSFTDVPKGKYSLEARRPGFFRQGLNQHENFWTGIAVGPGLASEDIVFRLQPDASISGIATDNQTEGVEGAQVLLFATELENGKRTTSLAQQATTDDTGHYRFAHLRPGSYYVAVQARPWYAQAMAGSTIRNDAEQPGSAGTDNQIGRSSTVDMVYPFTFYPGVTDSSAATAIVVKAGEQANGDVVLIPVPSIHLRIRHPGMADGQSTALTLSQRLFGSYTWAVPAGSSGFRGGIMDVSSLPPGQFTLTMQTYGDNVQAWTQDISLYGDSEISLREADSPVSITGVITQAAVPVTSQPMVVLSGPGGTARVAASKDGKFQISQYLPPGVYEVSVYNVPESLVSNITATGARVTGRSIEIGAPGLIGLAIEMSRGVGRIEGTALRDDKPAPGVMVLLVPLDLEHNPSLVRRDQSDSDGTFNLRFVAPGAYTVLALNNGWDIEWAKPEVLKPYLQRGQTIEVVAGKKSQVRVAAQ
jgi:Carboxypeptidase regulatory-like domain